MTANIEYINRLRKMILLVLPSSKKQKDAITLQEISRKTGLGEETISGIINDFGGDIYFIPPIGEEPARYCKSSPV